MYLHSTLWFNKPAPTSKERLFESLSVLDQSRKLPDSCEALILPHLRILLEPASKAADLECLLGQLGNSVIVTAYAPFSVHIQENQVFERLDARDSTVKRFVLDPVCVWVK